MKTLTSISLSLALVLASSAETVSILLNVGSTAEKLNSTRTKRGGETTKATANDFRAADPRIGQATPVNRVTGITGTVWYLLGFTPLVDSKGEAHEIELSGEQCLARNAGPSSWNDLTPILDSHIASTDNVSLGITVHGIKEAKGTITLTLWGVGYNHNQQARFTPSYGGKTLEPKSTNFGSKRSSQEGSTPFVQFSFEADGKSDSISFKWDNPNGEAACLNGFAITYDQ